MYFVYGETEIAHLSRREIDRARFEVYRKRYHPYASVASLYLWEIAAGR